MYWFLDKYTLTVEKTIIFIVLKTFLRWSFYAIFSAALNSAWICPFLLKSKTYIILCLISTFQPMSLNLPRRVYRNIRTSYIVDLLENKIWHPLTVWFHILHINRNGIWEINVVPGMHTQRLSMWGVYPHKQNPACLYERGWKGGGGRGRGMSLLWDKWRFFLLALFTPDQRP